MYEYKAYVERVVDGDTLQLSVSLGFYITTNIRVRLGDIDTPEKYGRVSDAERAHGHAASDFVRDLIEGTTVTVKTSKTGKYGRWIADVYLEDGSKLSDILRENNFEKLDSYTDLDS